MKREVLLFAFVALLVTTAGTSEAQKVKKGVVSGTLDTFAGRSDTSPTLLSGHETPFIITDLCVGASGVAVELDGQALSVSVDNTCRTFSPGIAVPVGGVVSCTTDNTHGPCLITGVFSR